MASPARLGEVTSDLPEWDPGGQRWLRLAEAREPSDPGDALAVYLRLIDAQLETTGRSAYARAIEILKRARRGADATGQGRAFADHLAALHERHRRRPTLIAMLNKAAPDEDAEVGGPP
jgi:uncharacterized Zn finger protein